MGANMRHISMYKPSDNELGYIKEIVPETEQAELEKLGFQRTQPKKGDYVAPPPEPEPEPPEPPKEHRPMFTPVLKKPAAPKRKRATRKKKAKK